MKIEIDGLRLTVIREPKDPRFYGLKNAAGESQFLYHLKKWWNEKVGTFENPLYNCKLIKKRMGKDGHMVDEMQQYLRSAKPVKVDDDGDKLYLAIHNTHWAINGLNDDFNEGKAVIQISLITISETEIYKHSRYY